MATADAVRARLAPLRPTSLWVGLTAFIMAFIVGLAVFAVVFWVVNNPWVWVAAVIVAFGYLSRQAVPSEVIGVSLYLVALCTVALPVVAFLSGLAGSEAAADIVGNLFGLILGGFVAVLVGIVIAGVGYLFNRRAAKVTTTE